MRNPKLWILFKSALNILLRFVKMFFAKVCKNVFAFAIAKKN